MNALARPWRGRQTSVFRVDTRPLDSLDHVVERHRAAAPDHVLNAIRGLLQRVLESEPETILSYLTVQGSPFIAAARDDLAARLVVFQRRRRAGART